MALISEGKKLNIKIIIKIIKQKIGKISKTTAIIVIP